MLHQDVTIGHGIELIDNPSRTGIADRIGQLTHRSPVEGTIGAGSWRSRAVEAHLRAEQGLTNGLRDQMAARLLSLTGSVIAPEAIFVNTEARRATTVLDGVIFRLDGSDLTILRACAYCGTDQFTSPAIRTIADLGFALTDWTPLHKDCQPEDPAE
jgi:hypothetical protein